MRDDIETPVVDDKSVRDDFSPSMAKELDKVIAEYKDKIGSSIPTLQRAQEIVGYLPPVVQRRVARGLNIPESEIHSIVSFYSFFTMKPRGDHFIKVCLGTACYVKGIEGILNKLKELLKIDVGGTTKDRKFSLEAVRCLGACGLAPVMVVGEDTYGALDQKKAAGVISQYDPTLTEAESPTMEEGIAEKGK